jgi:hypothetical protein
MIILCKRGKNLIFYLFNGLIFVFDGKKSRFFDHLGLLVVRWGQREWPITGPVEIKDFHRCIKAHLCKFRTIFEVWLWWPEN